MVDNGREQEDVAMKRTALAHMLIAAIPGALGVGVVCAATLEEIQAPPSLPSLETGPPSAVPLLPSLDSGPPSLKTPLPGTDPGLPSLDTPLPAPGSNPPPLRTPAPPADPMIPAPAPALPESVPVG